jgi:hypothetical protein
MLNKYHGKMTATVRMPSPARILFLAVAFARLAHAVDLMTCNANLQSRLDNRTLPLNDPIFYFNGTKYMSDRNNIQLTIEGCRASCPRPDHDLYGDMWPRLLTWLIPALLLIGNLHIPKVGTLNRLLILVHFVGDPVDSMWSLLTKAEVWNRFYRIAVLHTPPGQDQDHSARGLAVILSSFEELTGDMASVRQELDMIVADSGPGLSKEDLDYIMLETADELVDSRSNEVLRTSLVIINYMWHVLGALVPAIGGEQSSKPGGRIGTAMFLSWLITVVLLSNTLSGFTSRRTCLRIMERYCRTIKGRNRDVHFFPNTPRIHSKSKLFFKSSRAPAKPMDFIDAQPWNGSVYSFRGHKGLIPSGTRFDHSPFYLLTLSILPILVASASAFVIIFFTPAVGLGCRTLWVIGITIGILISPILTWVLGKFATGKYGWYLTILKDMAIGIPSITVIILSSIGVFNTCWCWSAVYSLGYAKAFIILDPGDERALNAKLLYPVACAICLGLQIIVFGLMYQMMKPGGQVFRLKEDDKMEQYRKIHGLDSSAASEMGRRSEARVPLLRHTSEDDHLTLPPPAISPHASPRLAPRTKAQGTSDDGHGHHRYSGSYGGSPEWRSPDQPLLGSPLFNRGSTR